MIQGAHVACGMGTMYHAREAPEILPAIAAIPEHKHGAEDIMTRNMTHILPARWRYVSYKCYKHWYWAIWLQLCNCVAATEEQWQEIACICTVCIELMWC
ncbi:MAG: hypothetical protein KA536_06525 [Saprospiraceae bacterium]|nr:hypothetical protein [Saprospiraceae bacterium]